MARSRKTKTRGKPVSHPTSAEPQLGDGLATVDGEAAREVKNLLLPRPVGLKVGATLLDGRFELRELIGHVRDGVWRAVDHRASSNVAIKVFNESYGREREHVENFFRGARQMRQLHHPGIVKVIEDWCESDGYYFFVMEFVEGGDLEQTVNGGGLSLEQTLQIVMDLGDALAFAHEAGVVHGEVNPWNVLLTRPDSKAKLTHFGLGEPIGAQSRSREELTVGALRYTAPETLWSNKPPGKQADVFGLGMTAIFAIHGAEVPRKTSQKMEGVAETLRLNQECYDVLTRAVATELDHRWSSVAELNLAFRRALQNGPVLVRRRAGPGVTIQDQAWASQFFERLERDELKLTEQRLAERGRWFIQLRLPEQLRERYGTASEVLVVATAAEVRGEDLEAAQEELRRREYDLDPDLLVILDGHPRLEERLQRIFQAWGQWVPWPMVDGSFPPLANVLCTHLPAHDVFDKKDPVRGREVIGRSDLVADLSRRLRQGEALGIFGLRKIGKTTLVLAATDKLDPTRHLLAPGKASGEQQKAPPLALVLWLDADDPVLRNLEALLHQLGSSLFRRLEALGEHERFRVPSEHTLETVSELLRQVLDAFPICIVLDEYDLLFDSEAGGGGIAAIDWLFRMFRGLAQTTRKLSLVVIGRDSEFLDRPEMGGRPNPMLNWVVSRWLGPLDARAAADLLHRLGRRVGLDVGKNTTQLALEWTGGHPLLHRQFGSALLELSREKERTGDLIATDEFCEQAIDLFLDRYEVTNTCREVLYLLETRYAEAGRLMTELSLEEPVKLTSALEAVGGWRHPTVRVLRNFGLLLGTAQSPVIPELLRWYVRTLTPDRRKGPA